MVQADCGHHGNEWSLFSASHDSNCNISIKINLKKAVQIITIISIVVFIAFAIFLIVRIACQPESPQFILLNLTVDQFELTGELDNYQTSIVVQPTVSSFNRNRATGIQYEHFAFSVAYKDQQITEAGEAPPLYQGHKDVRMIRPSSFLAGYQVHVAAHLCGALTEDYKAGHIVLTVNLDVNFRWNYGMWTSDQQHLVVSCPAALSFRNDGGQTSVAEFQQTSACSVSS